MRIDLKEATREETEYHILLMHVYDHDPEMLAAIQAGQITPPANLIEVAMDKARELSQSALRSKDFTAIVETMAYCRQLLHDTKANFEAIGFTWENHEALLKQLKAQRKKMTGDPILSGHTPDAHIEHFIASNEALLPARS